jgi:hypothetical protein
VHLTWVPIYLQMFFEPLPWAFFKGSGTLFLFTNFNHWQSPLCETDFSECTHEKIRALGVFSVCNDENLSTNGIVLVKKIFFFLIYQFNPVFIISLSHLFFFPTKGDYHHVGWLIFTDFWSRKIILIQVFLDSSNIRRPLQYNFGNTALLCREGVIYFAASNFGKKNSFLGHQSNLKP